MKRRKAAQAYCAIGAMAATIGGMSLSATAGPEPHSVARQWNEANLNAIRKDFARPTVHARNLFHVSVAMWDAWAAYDDVADQWLSDEDPSAEDIEEARAEAISFAAYRVLQARYAKSPGAGETLPAIDALMDSLGYDKAFTATIGGTPAAVGNRIAVNVLYFGLNDNANEEGGFANECYVPVNEPLLPDFPGNPQDIDPEDGFPDYELDPGRWQPLALEFFKDQGGIIIGEYPEALSPEWGIVTPFSLKADDLTVYPAGECDPFEWWVYHDPGPPPYINEIDGQGNDYYKWGNEMVSIWSSHLDPADGVMWDISPGGIGNAPLADSDMYEAYFNLLDGGDWGTGYDINPVTGEPYEAQIVPRGDYARVLAEFWADGPDSETPPGHWFSILNYVNDHELFEKRMEGEGPIIDDLEWDVKSYLAMGGAMHDIAIAAWGIKGYYDYIRPISAIRYLAQNGQCTDEKMPSFHALGINLLDGYIELVTEESSAPGEKHEHLAGDIDKVAILAWRGPDYIDDEETDTAGVGWILAENWWPYQRPSFVTPPFPGYVSGHSTYSRGASELMTIMTGSEYFPGGLGEFHCPQNEFLVFEDGPSVDMTLQWATYRDASDQTSLSRIWGGIHPPADDLPGRHIGQVIGPEAFGEAKLYFNGRISCPADLDGDGAVSVTDLIDVISLWGTDDIDGDVNLDGVVDVGDLTELLLSWGDCG
jgi:hypothetical protein